MKKIFYFIASAIVALGAVACQNEGLDNIAPEANGDTVSFVATIEDTKTDLLDNATIWDDDDTIVVNWIDGTEDKVSYFKNNTNDRNTFTCTEVGLSAIKEVDEIIASYSNKNDGTIDSEAGTAGAWLYYKGTFADLNEGNKHFEVKNAFLKFTADKGAVVTLTASAEIFSTGTELTLTATGAEQYVAVLPAATTITYAVDGIEVKTSKENTLEVKKIYDLGNLETPAPEAITIDKFLKKSVDKTVWYQLTGEITDILSTSYGNFYLKDDTGYVYVYGLTATKVTKNDQSFSSLDLAAGDIITIFGTRDQYANAYTEDQKEQVGGPAYFISSVIKPMVATVRKSLSFSADSSSETITITTRGEGELTYSQGDADWISIENTNNSTNKNTNSHTFVVTVDENKVEEERNATITFTYADQTATISVTQAKPGETVIEDVVATISFANKEQRTTFTTSQQIWKQNNITVTNDKGSSTSNVADYANPARFYKSSKLTVEVPGNIGQIVFDCNSASYATALKTSISTETATVSVDSDKVTVTPKSSATSFVIASLTGGQVRMDSLTVTYTTNN